MKTVVNAPRPLAETDNHDRFDCGREFLNTWFRRYAWLNPFNNILRVTVLTEMETSRIVGYFTLSAAQIERSFLAKPQQFNRPDPAPAILLGNSRWTKTFRDEGAP